MIINNINSQYGLIKKNELDKKKSMEKLITGTKVNRAADDAAGLSISEKMRALIRGLDQAGRNIQDTMSLLQVADGGLNEIHSLLQRSRELMVQANNDTLQTEDRTSIQDEVDQINKEIDNIANSTRFNDISLLNSSGVSSMDKPQVNNIFNGLKNGWLEEAEKKIYSAYGLHASGSSNLNIVLDEGAPYGELAHVGGASGNLELHIDIEDFNPADGDSGNTVAGPGFYADRVIAHEFTHAVMDDALGVNKMNDFHYNNAVWFVEGTAEFIPGADERLKQVVGNSMQTGIDDGKVSNLVDRAVELLNGAEWHGDDVDYSAGYIIVKYINSNLTTGTFKDIMNVIMNYSGSATDALKNSIVTYSSRFTSYADFVNKFGSVGADGARYFINNKEVLNWGTQETDTGSIEGSDFGGISLNAEDVIDESADSVKDQPLQFFNVVWPDKTESGNFMVQIGANAQESMEIKLVNVTTSSLGIDSINAISEASASIQKLDDAIKFVSNKRARLGAISNGLEFFSNVDSDIRENMQSAESKIRDTDMASQMTMYSKQNILSQISNSLVKSVINNSQNDVDMLLNKSKEYVSENNRNDKHILNEEKKNGSELSKNIEKLSSGLRINRAADDAAGSSISEKMKAQIRGLSQAQNNIEDGISLVKTAEGGLNEIQSILQRERELCVYAANDVQSFGDRKSIQDEIDQLNAEIDRIANSTKFNDLNLLNVDDDGKEVTYSDGTPLSLIVAHDGQFGLQTVQGYSNAVEDDNQILIYGHGSTSRPIVVIDGKQYSLRDGNLTSPTIQNGDTYETGYTVQGIQIKQSVTIVGTDKNMFEIRYDIVNNSGANKKVGFLFNLDTMLGSDDYAPYRIDGKPVVTERAYTGQELPNEFDVYNHTTNRYLESKAIINGQFDGIGIIETPDKLVLANYPTVDDWNFTPTGRNIGDSDYSIWWNEKDIANGAQRSVNTFYGLKKPNFFSAVPYDGIKIQTGANAGQSMTINRRRVNTDAIGSQDVCVTSRTSANYSLDVLDKAIGIISHERSRYGAYENTLDKAYSLAQNQELNLTEAQSRIADLDMAKGIMEFAKNNILSRSIEALIAQSNTSKEQANLLIV
ncbi:flagellinolysin [Clostridium oryzae]|uniref:Flagellin n=1 Tax=Clostridium oryzae TaxID=1450648 RepID=A0A1V4ISY7_9CLOT|nr:flagellinolysin [Clostridium oryzae]OPJ62915.1 flagellin [Clostridium oryzae]